MLGIGNIDTTFDFRSDTPPSDTPPEKDPDYYSPTLRKYHKILWSKPLPNGVLFELDDTKPKSHAYLHHQSEVGEFFLSSDAVIPTFRKERSISHIINQISVEEQEDFMHMGYTIGGMMLFPGNQIDGKMTINGQRGCHPRIKDRFDLTVECIRLHYQNEDRWSPLSKTLARYADFFLLFGDFRGYVEFFMLQDLVTEDYSAVKFSMPFEGFCLKPFPDNMDAYIAYRELAVAFIEARNRRILEAC